MRKTIEKERKRRMCSKSNYFSSFVYKVVSFVCCNFVVLI